MFILGNQHLTCSWVKERWEDPRGDGLRSGERTERNGCKGLEKLVLESDKWKKIWRWPRSKLGCRAKETERTFI
jgi:hypothetical protein